jgi:hypothetical protein
MLADFDEAATDFECRNMTFMTIAFFGVFTLGHTYGWKQKPNKYFFFLALFYSC